MCVFAPAPPPQAIPRAPAAARLTLALNVATSAAGRLRVGLEDRDGVPIPGRGLEDCDPIVGDALDRAVTWAGDAELADLAGRELRIVFELRDADLFAFQIR